MKRALPYLLLGISLYLVALLVMFPLGVAAPWIASTLKGRGVELSAAGLSGTLWNGSATAMSVGPYSLGAVQWRTDPLQFALGRYGAVWQVRPDGGYLTGTGSVGVGGEVVLTGVEGRMPAAPLLARVFTAFDVDGLLSVKFDELRLKGGEIYGLKGSVVWHQAALARPIALKLGDLKIALHSAEDGSLVGDISDGGGPLDAKGQITVAGKNYHLTATVATRPGADPVLASALAMLGPADAQGRHTIQFNGQL